MLITDTPPIENELRRSIPIETMIFNNNFEKAKSSCFYFRLTDTDFTTPKIADNTISDMSFEVNNLWVNQIAFMSFANKALKNSTPLIGNELLVLNKTFKRLLSKKPTKLEL